jgi:hypothetical protein
MEQPQAKPHGCVIDEPAMGECYRRMRSVALNGGNGHGDSLKLVSSAPLWKWARRKHPLWVKGLAEARLIRTGRYLDTALGEDLAS